MTASPQYEPNDPQLADAFEGYLTERRGIPADQIERVTQFNQEKNPQFTGNGKTQYAIDNETICYTKGLGEDWKIYLLNYMQNTGAEPVTYYQKSKIWMKGNTLHMPAYAEDDSPNNGYPTMAEANAAPLQNLSGGYPNYDRQ